MDGEILQVLRDVVGRLHALRTDYMLTGSLALGYYVEPRMTRDIDIVVELDTLDASDFMREFEASYYVPRELIEAADERGTMFNLIEQTAIIKVDFVIRRGGEYRELEFSRRRWTRLHDFECWVVSPEDLILSKLLWFAETDSAIQSADARALLRLNGLDAEYLGRWATHLGVGDKLRELADA